MSSSPKFDVPVSPTTTSFGRKNCAMRGQNHVCVIISLFSSGTTILYGGTGRCSARGWKLSSAAVSFGRRCFIPIPS
jgi:hypothetical protein